jgi:hypothetical protein
MQLTLSPSYEVVGRKAPPGSAYYDPIGVATQLILADEPMPVDLQCDLEAMGYLIDEFKLDVITKAMGHEPSIGFHLV